MSVKESGRSFRGYQWHWPGISVELSYLSAARLSFWLVLSRLLSRCLFSLSSPGLQSLSLLTSSCPSSSPPVLGWLGHWEKLVVHCGKAGWYGYCLSIHLRTGTTYLHYHHYYRVPDPTPPHHHITSLHHCTPRTFSCNWLLRPSGLSIASFCGLAMGSSRNP